MTDGQWTALILILVILGLEIVRSPLVQSVLKAPGAGQVNPFPLGNPLT